MPELLNVDEVAKLLRTTPESLRTLMSAGRDVPPSFQIGRRRVFLRRTVFDWLYRKAGIPNHDLHPDQSTSGSQSTKETPMAALLEVAEGDVLIVKDDDTEITVAKLYPKSGYAVIHDAEERESTVTIKNLLDAVESGDLAQQEADE